MHKTLIAITVTVGITAFVASRNAVALGGRAMQEAASGSCGQLTAGDLEYFIQTSKNVASAPAASELRAELDLPAWPADSVVLVNDAGLCARLDALVVAWLSGPGAGTLAGVTGTIGSVSVARVATTIFHVKPGSSVPTQPHPHYPYFVVDTAAPTRVAYWGGTGD